MFNELNQIVSLYEIHNPNNLIDDTAESENFILDFFAKIEDVNTFVSEKKDKSKRRKIIKITTREIPNLTNDHILYFDGNRFIILEISKNYNAHDYVEILASTET